jgi:hypothetical protein
VVLPLRLKSVDNTLSATKQKQKDRWMNQTGHDAQPVQLSNNWGSGLNRKSLM